MSKIVQIGFKLNVPAPQYRRIVESAAQSIAQIPGLCWKIWFLNEEVAVAGGIYLFEDEPARDTFLASDLAHELAAAPFHNGLEIKLFDVMPEVTATTRGPLAIVATTGSPAPSPS